MKLDEEKRQAFLISSLGLVAKPTGLQYSDIVKIEQAEDLIFLGMIGKPDALYFLPRHTSFDAMKAAISQIENTPAPNPELAAALYELWLTTKKAKMSDTDRDAQLAVYAKRLGAYDIDHVRIVLSDWSMNQPFWPAWADLQAQLDALSGWRRTMRNALRNAADRLNREAMLKGDQT